MSKQYFSGTKPILCEFTDSYFPELQIDKVTSANLMKISDITSYDKLCCYFSENRLTFFLMILLLIYFIICCFLMSTSTSDKRKKRIKTYRSKKR